MPFPGLAVNLRTGNWVDTETVCSVSVHRVTCCWNRDLLYVDGTISHVETDTMAKALPVSREAAEASVMERGRELILDERHLVAWLRRRLMTTFVGRGIRPFSG